jgi:hypothetical protein
MPADTGLPVFGTLASWLLTVIMLCGYYVLWHLHQRVQALEHRLDAHQDVRPDGGTPALRGAPISALAQIQCGDRITGPDGTQWRVVDPTDHNNTVWLHADSGGDLWVARDECRRNLAEGTFDHSHRAEGDQ